MGARQDFARHVQQETPLPVYALIGSSALLLHEGVSALQTRVVTTAAAFNSDVFMGAQSTGAAIIAAAATLPVMAPRRWVLVHDCHKLPAKEQPALLAYLKNPAPSTVLCLVGEKLDLRTKLGAALNKSGALFHFEPPRPHELSGWLVQRARQQALHLEGEAAALLVDLVGHDLGALQSALDKVALYAGSDTPLTPAHVSEAVAATRVRSVFELVDAVGQRQWAIASTLLNNLLGGGESSLLLLTMIVRQLRLLLRYHHAVHSGLRGPALAQALGVRPFVLENLREQTRHFTTSALQRALILCGRTDQQLKSSRMDHRLLLDGLLLDIIAAEA